MDRRLTVPLHHFNSAIAIKNDTSVTVQKSPVCVCNLLQDISRGAHACLVLLTVNWQNAKGVCLGSRLILVKHSPYSLKILVTSAFKVASSSILDKLDEVRVNVLKTIEKNVLGNKNAGFWRIDDLRVDLRRFSDNKADLSLSLTLITMALGIEGLIARENVVFGNASLSKRLARKKALECVPARKQREI